MKRTEYSSPLLRESYVKLTHDSGLEIYLFPKKMTSVYALFAVRFGSIDNRFSLSDGGDEVLLPDGVAHFLEHKLFDNPDGSDSFSRFFALGVDSNAYTDYNRTAYLFHGTSGFEEALEELLSFVTTPYFTKETVKKEQGIIAEEIRMYEDSPWDCVYQNLLSAMYHTHPVRNNICGSEESIARITPELLYRAHSLFYALPNMALVVCGDVSEDEILAVADRVLPKKGQGERLCRRIPAETDLPEQTRIDARMNVSKPIFNIGIKDSVIPDDPRERIRRDFAMTMLNELLFSQSGEFYSALFEEGLITPSFGHGYSSADGFAFNCISGESDTPEVVLERFWSYLERVKREGLPNEDVERVRRVMYADEIRAYDSTEEIANRLLSFVFEDADMLEAPELIRSITKEELEELLRGFYVRERCVLSTVRPFEDGSAGEERREGNE